MRTSSDNVVGNWGLAIILLTLSVKLVLYPLTAKSFQSIAAMRRVKPAIDEINEKYADDREKKGAAMMELYKEHKINPFGGCLAAAAAAPHLVGAVHVAVHATWSCSSVRSLASGRTSLHPIHYYVLPLALGLLMWVQQKITPSTMDPAQAKMMLYVMPAMITSFMLFLPAGLCLYMFTNSVLSIAQQRFIEYRLAHKHPTTRGREPGRGGLVIGRPEWVVPSEDGTWTSVDTTWMVRCSSTTSRATKIAPNASPRADPMIEDDEKADDARRVTQGILDRMDLDARVTVREDDERVVLDIDGPDAGRAIGKKGMTLEALQFLVNKIVNRDPDERRHIVLDSGDYRDRHDSGLVAMAKREAKRAVTSGRAVTLEPMSARDRRVIHVSLAKFPGVSTRSEGEGTDRACRSSRPAAAAATATIDDPRAARAHPSPLARPRARSGRAIVIVVPAARAATAATGAHALWAVPPAIVRPWPMTAHVSRPLAARARSRAPRWIAARASRCATTATTATATDRVPTTTVTDA